MVAETMNNLKDVSNSMAPSRCYLKFDDMRFDICIMRSQRFLFERQIRSFSYGSIERLLSFLRVARKTISHVTINVKKASIFRSVWAWVRYKLSPYSSLRQWKTIGQLLLSKVPYFLYLIKTKCRLHFIPSYCRIWSANKHTLSYRLPIAVGRSCKAWL